VSVIKLAGFELGIGFGGYNSLKERDAVMSVIILKLPEVKIKDETRPSNCPYCQGDAFQRWGKIQKPVLDSRIQAVWVYRYFCCNCGRTFRYYPEGIDRADQTKRLRNLAPILWVLGLSLRTCQKVLSAMGVNMSHMSIWRDLREQPKLLGEKKDCKWVRILGDREAYAMKKKGVQIAVDLGDGEAVIIGQVEEDDPEALKEWLESLAKDLGIEVSISEDLSGYRIVRGG
jgi:transposase-like protein